MKYKLMFTNISNILMFTSVLILSNCGSHKPVNLEDPFTEVEAEFNAIKNSIISAGGVADVGIGRSPRRDIAKAKAKKDGQKNLAEIFEVKVQNLSKQFQEELGSDASVEINETFSSATKTVVNRKLNFAISKNTQYIQENIDGKNVYVCYVLMAIEPGVINQSIMDELQTQDQKTYERFRASQAFEELDASMKEYEAKENNQ